MTTADAAEPKVIGYKALTHDFRPPIQGGDPIWDGTPGAVLPKVKVDRSSAECGAGWNYVDSIGAALSTVGMWPTGRPSVIVAVEPIGKVTQRGERARVASLRILGRADDIQIAEAIDGLSDKWFDAAHAERMSTSQYAWRAALGRPQSDPAGAEAGLRAALKARGLDWELKQFGDAWDAWAAWAAWDARDAWAARAARAARDAWDAWAARAALIWQYAGLMGWVEEPARLTTGIREAYGCGLGIAIPTGPNELGWAMDGGPA